MSIDGAAWPVDPEHVRALAAATARMARAPRAYQSSRALGRQIRELRAARALNRRELALESGVAELQIEFLEAGLIPDAEILYDEIDALAEILDADVADLLADFLEPEPGEETFPVRIADRVRRLRGLLAGYLEPGVSGRLAFAPRGPDTTRRGPTRDLAADQEPEAITAEIIADEGRLWATVHAGPAHAGWSAVALQLHDDQESYTQVASTILDADGQGRMELPPDLDFALVVLAQDRAT